MVDLLKISIFFNWSLDETFSWGKLDQSFEDVLLDPLIFVDLLDYVVHHLLKALGVVALLVGPQKSGFLHPVRRYILFKVKWIDNHEQREGKMKQIL